MKNKKTNLIAVIVLVVVLAAAGLLYMKFKPGTTAGDKEITVKVSALENGEESFTYQTDAEYLGEVLTANKLIEGEDGQYGLFITTANGVKADDSKQQWWCTYQTDAEYLGEVLTANKLIEGEDGQYGLFITTANGVKADDSKQQWWCITKGGEQVNTSADQTPIQDGDQFELTLTEGY